MWKMNIATKQRCANTYSPQESHANLPKYVYIWRLRHLSYNLCKYTFTHGNTLASAALDLISGILCSLSWREPVAVWSRNCAAQSYPAILISTGYLFYRLQIGRCASLADAWWERVSVRWSRRGGMTDKLRNEAYLGWTEELNNMFSDI